MSGNGVGVSLETCSSFRIFQDGQWETTEGEAVGKCLTCLDRLVPSSVESHIGQRNSR